MYPVHEELTEIRNHFFFLNFPFGSSFILKSLINFESNQTGRSGMGATTKGFLLRISESTLDHL